MWIDIHPYGESQINDGRGFDTEERNVMFFFAKFPPRFLEKK
jgi:hypothetical protein